MTATIHEFPTFTDRSNARKAALKRGLEPSEFTITKLDDRKFEIKRRPGAIAESREAALKATSERLADEALKMNAELDKRRKPAGKTPADRGVAAAKADARAMTPQMQEIEKAQIRASDPGDRAAEAASIFACKRPDRRHLDALAAAYRGEMPSEPDLSAPAHIFYRKHLARAVELVKAKNRVLLAEFIATIRPACSSRRPIVAYGKLALIALSR